MSNNNNCFLFSPLFDRALNNILWLTIQSAGRFVQDQDRSIKIQSTRQYDPLSLPTTQLTSRFSNHGIESLIQVFYKIPDIRFFTSFNDPFFVLILIGETNIIANRIMKQNRLLRHNTDQSTERRFRNIPDIQLIEIYIS